MSGGRGDEGGMKRVLFFVLLGPVLFVLCIWLLFLPLAILVEGGGIRFNIEVDSYTAMFLGLMSGGLVLAAAEWVAEMLVMRPWFTALMGWAMGAALIGTWFDLTQPTWWWFIVKGLLVGIPALVCSWLVKRTQKTARQ
jgi:hypothetical protein